MKTIRIKIIALHNRLKMQSVNFLSKNLMKLEKPIAGS